MAHDPASIAAASMVRRFLEANPDAADAARMPGSVCVVEVTAASWMVPIADAWCSLVLGLVPPGHGPDTPCPERRPGKGWPEQRSLADDEEQPEAPAARFLRDGGMRSGRTSQTEDEEKLRRAVEDGKHVLGVSHDPSTWLPKALLRAADVSIRIPPPDGAALAEAARAVTGRQPMQPVTDVATALITADDLRLARRPGDEADAYLRRVLRLAGRHPGAGGLALSLADLHGMDEAVAWGMRLARDLQDYKRGIIGWSQVDRGLLLSGPPGVGKTIFARALATTCRVPLVASSLSTWQAADEAHLGHMLRAMRASFAQARSAAPAVLFIDEIDGIGDRANLVAQDRDYWMMVINALLELLDGIQQREGVVVVGACNQAHRIDPAVLRSGRLDRHIRVGVPDAGALARILRVHLGGDLPEADLDRLALIGLGGTGADVERWVRSARQRARHGSRPLTEEDLAAEVRGGRAARRPELVRRVAVHEAGHALMAELQRPGSLVKVDVQEIGLKGGGTVVDDVDGSRLLTRAEAQAELRMLLAGRAAEEVLLGEPSSGAGGGGSSDLARATMAAAAMLGSFGLAADEDGGDLTWSPLPEDGSSLRQLLASRPSLARAVSATLSEAFGQARAMLSERRGQLERLASLIAAEGLLTGDRVRAVIAALPSVEPQFLGSQPWEAKQ